MGAEGSVKDGESSGNGSAKGDGEGYVSSAPEDEEISVATTGRTGVDGLGLGELGRAGAARAERWWPSFLGRWRRAFGDDGLAQVRQAALTPANKLLEPVCRVWACCRAASRL